MISKIHAKCNVNPFSSQKAEDGEEDQDKPSSNEAIKRTNWSNRPNYSIKENPKQLMYVFKTSFEKASLPKQDTVFF